MKRLSAAYSIAVLAGPLVIIAMLLAVPFGCGGGGGGGAAAPTPTPGTVELGFVDSPTMGFQAIALNVIAVRLNPSTSPDVLDSDLNWVTIGVPSGEGATGEVAVNLLDFQNDVSVFNTTSVPAQTYHQIEVEVDPDDSGTITPSCPTLASQVEGCVDYHPLKFAPGTNANLRTSGTVVVTANSLTPLLIDISPGTPVAPATTGGLYTLSCLPASKTCPTLSLGTTTGLMAKVTGKVTPASVTGQTVTAELSGTSVVIASAPVVNGMYTFYLPAADTPVGTAYDLYVSGGNASFAAVARVAVDRSGATFTQPTLSVTPNAGGGAITGAVGDNAHNNSGIMAAAMVLLLPVNGLRVEDCSLGVENCVAVMSTATDEFGDYTLSPVPFADYAIEAQATGVASQSNPIDVTGTSATCTNSINPSNCSFSLKSATITGKVTIANPGAGTSSAHVTILAEQSGTGNLVGTTSVDVPGTGGTQSVPFTIEVPPGEPVDLFATAQDSFLGLRTGTEFPGHKLGVFAKAVPGSMPSLDIDCAGQGSVAGKALSPDAGTLVRLFKDDTSKTPPVAVQLMQTKVGSKTTVINGKPGQVNPGATEYSFCAPPDSYTVRRFEQPNATASPMAVGPPQPITVAAPKATASPCPICASSDGSCPGICTATQAQPL